MDTWLLLNLTLAESAVGVRPTLRPENATELSETRYDYFQERELVHRATSSDATWIDGAYVAADLLVSVGNASSPDNRTVAIVQDGSSSTDNPALALLLGLFCAFTVFGNVLVMAAVARERYLHAVTNYFIVSLATADCLVGALVMPFSVVHEAMGKFWMFGREWCDAWHSVDVLGSTASILNLCVISLDRYWAITDPMTYPRKMSTRRACVLIAAVWVCAALISFPAIAWWRAVSHHPQVGSSPAPSDSCVFTADVGYLVFSSIISFYGPLTVMLFTYYRIYRAAAEQTRSLRLGTKQVLACNGEDAVELTLRIHRGGAAAAVAAAAAAAGATNYRSDHGDVGCGYPTSPLPLPLGIEDDVEKNSLGAMPKHLKHFSFSRKLARIAKEQKAAKTLGIVMGVFVLCWMPFFLCNVLLGFCPSSCFRDLEFVSSVVTWLGWINSGMNPVIYACWSRDFRRAFAKILCVCCPKIARRNRRRNGSRARVCHSVCTPVSSACSAECIRL